jgi:hypothetical protein
MEPEGEVRKHSGNAQKGDIYPRGTYRVIALGESEAAGKEVAGRAGQDLIPPCSALAFSQPSTRQKLVKKWRFTVGRLSTECDPRHRVRHDF